MSRTTSQPTILPIDHFAQFADGLDHPEGVTAGPDGTLYAGGEAGQIYRVADRWRLWVGPPLAGGFPAPEPGADTLAPATTRPSTPW